jgi:hypothetical protein
MGVPVSSAASADPDSRQISIVTVWNRYDIDGDGELELVELIYSGFLHHQCKRSRVYPCGQHVPQALAWQLLWHEHC